MTILVKEDIQQITQQQLQERLLLLPEWRKEIVLRYRNHLSQVQSTEAFLLLQDCLRRNYDIKEEITFEYGEHGKPTLKGHPNIHFNLSHCKTAVMCVVDTTPVGCDIECTNRSITSSLVRHCCNEQEVEKIEHADNPQYEFARLWTMKEAFYKLTGTGITDDIRNVLTSDSAQHITFTEYHYPSSNAIACVCKNN